MRALVILALAATPLAMRAQSHVHTPGMQHAPAEPNGASVGQAAFATLAEVVRTLEADPATDWSSVDLEALRQHLIDMDEVTMRAEVRTVAIPEGARFEVRGAAPRTVAAVKRMVVAHAPTLRTESGFQVSVSELPDGASLIVRAAGSGNDREVARIRGLGFAGLMTLGAHHAPHHLAIARGKAPHGEH